LIYSDGKTNENDLIVAKSEHFEILPYNLETKIISDENNYFINSMEKPIANFIVNIRNREVLVEKIMRPISIEVIGLEDILISNNNRIKEISKGAFNDSNIRLKVSNFDRKHKFLDYQLYIKNDEDDTIVFDSKKVEFGEELSWDLDLYRDRLLECCNMVISICVIDQYGELIYTKEILEVTEKIEMLNLEFKVEGTNLYLKWDEGQYNKNRVLKNYNITSSIEEPKEYKLKDGETSLVLDLTELPIGVFLPQVDFIKKKSLFENIVKERVYFKYEDLNGKYFVNKHGYKSSDDELYFSRLIWAFIKKDFKKACALIENINFSKYSLSLILEHIIQLKQSIHSDQRTEIFQLIKITRDILAKIFNEHSKDDLVNILHDIREDFNLNDLVYLVTVILSFRSDAEISDESKRKLMEIDLKSALCCSEHRDRGLNEGLIDYCKESFDYEVLRFARNHLELLKMIKSEIKIISGFWEWTLSRKNNQLLKMNYSKARLFRMYQIENKIETFKIVGRTMDDTVDSIVQEEPVCNLRINNVFEGVGDAERTILKDFISFIEDITDQNYKDVVKTAFISVCNFKICSDDEYFELMMRTQFSKRKELIDRYKAYLKLIFI
jgi:hypothetical protein